MELSKLKSLVELLESLQGAPKTEKLETSPTFESGKHIVILQRGWVVVGDLTQSGPTVTIENASVIRSWGTTKGIGQLALDGPQSSTKLDPCGTVKTHELAIIATMKCEESKW
jgi:hypothetical protein